MPNAVTPSPASTPSHSNSHSTALTTPSPSQQPPNIQNALTPSATNDSAAADDDIWAPDPPSTTHDPNSNSDQRDEELLSDIPSLRRARMADGYREGLSLSKARVAQRGFDEGYPLGVEMGVRVGRVLGVLEGIVAGLSGRSQGADGKEDEGEGNEDLRRQVEEMLGRARRELGREGLMEGVGEGEVLEARGVEGLRKVDEAVGRWERRVFGRVGVAMAGMEDRARDGGP